MINQYETQYKVLLNRILSHGFHDDSRAGKVRVEFGQSLGIDLMEGFPVLTGKQIFFKKAWAEWYWMWNGWSNLTYLRDMGITWWDHWAVDDAIPFSYGHNVKSFGGQTDQIAQVYSELVNGGRRGVLTFWNPNELHKTPLPPCYTSMTFVRVGQSLNMDFAIRSSDTAVGLPYDMVIGALFLIEMAQHTNLVPRYLKVNLSNAHIYENCIPGVEEYLARPMYDLPSYNTKTCKLEDYNCEPLIKMPLNV